MLIIIDPTSSTPPYEQIRMQIAALVRSGELAAGARLPTVRRLAGDLELAPNTVARTYRELENDGIIETRGRAGSFVSHPGDANERLGQAAADAYVERIRQLGIGADDAISYVQRSIDNAG
ncbi:GntR family transcriptional regulator [Leifsonia sp. YAF41]|uniref:GntR family transcriptional regulator n=1 Tax=Leifsonia sp. YAF41 TaxID=3233086 RepID=UPI003F997926